MEKVEEDMCRIDLQLDTISRQVDNNHKSLITLMHQFILTPSCTPAVVPLLTTAALGSLLISSTASTLTSTMSKSTSTTLSSHSSVPLAVICSTVTAPSYVSITTVTTSSSAPASTLTVSTCFAPSAMLMSSSTTLSASTHSDLSSASAVRTAPGFSLSVLAPLVLSCPCLHMCLHCCSCLSLCPCLSPHQVPPLSPMGLLGNQVQLNMRIELAAAPPASICSDPMSTAMARMTSGFRLSVASPSGAIQAAFFEHHIHVYSCHNVCSRCHKYVKFGGTCLTLEHEKIQCEQQEHSKNRCKNKLRSCARTIPSWMTTKSLHQRAATCRTQRAHNVHWSQPAQLALLTCAIEHRQSAHIRSQAAQHHLMHIKCHAWGRTFPRHSQWQHSLTALCVHIRTSILSWPLPLSRPPQMAHVPHSDYCCWCQHDTFFKPLHCTGHWCCAWFEACCNSCDCRASPLCVCQHVLLADAPATVINAAASVSMSLSPCCDCCDICLYACCCLD